MFYPRCIWFFRPKDLIIFVPSITYTCVISSSGGTHSGGGTALRGNYAGIGYTWDEDNNIFWPKKPYASWVKHNESASWKSPIGDAPALTAEQEAQNTPTKDAEGNVTAEPTHSWSYVWNEANQTWDLTDNKA